MAPGKAVRYYLKSKEKWKEKSKERRAIIRAQKITIRDLQTSREQWKQKAKFYKSTLAAQKKTQDTKKPLDQ